MDLADPSIPVKLSELAEVVRAARVLGGLDLLAETPTLQEGTQVKAVRAERLSHLHTLITRLGFDDAAFGAALRRVVAAERGARVRRQPRGTSVH